MTKKIFQKKRSAILFACILILSIQYDSYSQKKDKQKFLSIGKAVIDNLVSVRIMGIGGYSGECIEIEVNNLTDTDTALQIEYGRRLDSEEPATQDILIAHQNNFRIGKREKLRMKLFGFCCQAHNSAPGTSSQFRIGNLADSLLLKLARFLNSNRDLPLTAQQHAVWVISDDNPLESIHDEDTKKVVHLIKFVSQLKGVVFPWYSMTYKSDTTSLFSGSPTTLYADYEYELWSNCKASLIMYDENNHVLQKFFVDKGHGPDTYHYPIKLNVSEFQKGKYYIRLYANGQMKLERVFII